jgi:antitoxin component YwqK of YwqJK toxin-antitoxin module
LELVEIQQLLCLEAKLNQDYLFEVKNMKRHILFISFCILSAALILACTRTKATFWENGNLKSEIQYRNGKIHGKASWFYQDGSKFYEAYYVDEKLEGELTKWYSNGLLQSREQYRNDMLNGKSEYYNEKGRKTEEVYYVNDTINGDYRAWYDDRKIRIEGQYVNGMMDGKWFYWDEFGILIGEGDFDMGTGFQKKYNREGDLVGRLSFRDNEKHGKEIYYNDEGEVVKEVLYEDGEFVSETEIIPLNE